MTTPLPPVTAAIYDGVLARLYETPEEKALEANLRALHDKLRQLSPALASEAYDLVMEMGVVRGEEMFMEGWRLRGNPDALFDLPDPDS